MKPYYDHAGITIYHGDCREVLPTLEKNSVRLVWTDPPYGHGNQTNDLQASRVRGRVKGARVRDCVQIAADSGTEWTETIRGFLDLVPVVLKDDCCCCCGGGGGPRPSFANVALWMDEPPLIFFHAIVWDKSARGNGLGWRFRRNYEFIMVAHKANGKLSWIDKSVAVPNIFKDKPPKNTLHPTMKPESIVRQFIKLTTGIDDIILDPFMGSGTTLRAAKDMGRKAIGIEIEEKYCEIAAKRLEQEVFQFSKQE